MRSGAQALITCLLSAACFFAAAESQAAPNSAGTTAALRSSSRESSPSVAPRTGSSLAQLAQLMSQLPFPEASVVIFGPLEERQGSSLSEQARVSLHTQLVQVVGSSVPLARIRLSAPTALKNARTQARQRHLALVYVAPEVVGSDIVLEVTFTQWPTSFWQRALIPQGTTTLHETLKVPAAELIRRLLPPPPGLLSETRKFKSPIESPVALSCGDLNGDGAQELLVVGRRDLALGRFKSTSFVTEAKSSWGSLSPVAGAPLRAPLGSSAIDPQGAIVGLSDRARMVRLDASLKLLSHAPQAYPVSPTECLQFGPTGLSENTFPCALAEQAKRPPLIGSLDAWASGQTPDSSGMTHEVTVLLPVGESAISRIESGSQEGTESTLENVGDAMIVGDLDGDGTLELISSRTKARNSQDALQLFSLKNGQFVPILELKTGPVHALTICPFAGSNPQLVVAAIGSELWVLK